MAIVRDFRKDDIGDLSAAFSEAWNSLNVGEEWTKEKAKEYILWWVKSDSIFLVAEEDGKVVGGFVSEIKPWWSGKMLNDGELFVHPDYQGRGIGKMLFHEMMKRAGKEGVEEVSFFTYRNSPAHEWYMRIGMKDVEDWVIVEGKVADIIRNLDSGSP